MSDRSYEQFCGLAVALDAIGERWSLLIVRDLTLGARRSVDLQRGLPGIPTNVLYTRLSALQERGIVARRVTPPPTPATLYELTEAGRLLEPALEALDAWGVGRLAKPGARSVVRPESIELAVLRLARRLTLPAHPFEIEVRVNERTYAATWTARIDAPGLVRALEGASASPDVTLRCDVRTLYALAARTLTLRAASDAERVRLDGRATVLRRLLGPARAAR
jgi:DNA-binding HxlR family transcriptional regulator